jgi:hypothetical protein
MQNSLSVMNLPQPRGTNYELYASEPEVPTPVIETYFSISHSTHIITSEAHKKHRIASTHKKHQHKHLLKFFPLFQYRSKACVLGWYLKQGKELQ